MVSEHMITKTDPFTRCLAISVLLLMPLLANGQNQRKIDSIKIAIGSIPSDSSMLKIRAYQNICWEYAITRSKLDSASLYADSIRIISERINYEDGIPLSHFYYGVIERFNGNYYQGLNHLDKYLDYFQSSSRLA